MKSSMSTRSFKVCNSCLGRQAGSRSAKPTVKASVGAAKWWRSVFWSCASKNTQLSSILSAVRFLQSETRMISRGPDGAVFKMTFKGGFSCILLFTCLLGVVSRWASTGSYRSVTWVCVCVCVFWCETCYIEAENPPPDPDPHHPAVD